MRASIRPQKAQITESTTGGSTYQPAFFCKFAAERFVRSSSNQNQKCRTFFGLSIGIKLNEIPPLTLSQHPFNVIGPLVVRDLQQSATSNAEMTSSLSAASTFCALIARKQIDTEMNGSVRVTSLGRNEGRVRKVVQL